MSVEDLIEEIEIEFEYIETVLKELQSLYEDFLELLNSDIFYSRLLFLLPAPNFANFDIPSCQPGHPKCNDFNQVYQTRLNIFFNTVGICIPVPKPL